ncbi:MAG: enoyl-CoA hydratase/isomerase family protein [Elusimicrobia bacterium]|nr:enoyl-CoA hydratase/isomerase family protein [Elusimicrobiota bacterium]
MPYQRLIVERQNSVLRVTLNRFEARNALDALAMDELSRAFRDAAKDSDIRVAVLSGAGSDFCAGGDLVWMSQCARAPMAKNKKEAQRLLDMFVAIDEAPFAVVAKVQGNCFGAGLGLIGACDVVVAASDSRFAFSEAKLGLIPAVVSTFVIPKIGFGQARRLYVTAQIFSAQFGQDIGLVHEIADAAGLENKVQQTIVHVLSTAPGTTALSKAYLRQFEGLNRKGRVANAVNALAKIRATPQAKEGFTAFFEKRQPKWSL